MTKCSNCRENDVIDLGNEDVVKAISKDAFELTIPLSFFASKECQACGIGRMIVALDSFSEGVVRKNEDGENIIDWGRALPSILNHPQDTEIDQVQREELMEIYLALGVLEVAFSESFTEWIQIKYMDTDKNRFEEIEKLMPHYKGQPLIPVSPDDTWPRNLIRFSDALIEHYMPTPES